MGVPLFWSVCSYTWILRKVNAPIEIHANSFAVWLQSAMMIMQRTVSADRSYFPFLSKRLGLVGAPLFWRVCACGSWRKVTPTKCSIQPCFTGSGWTGRWTKDTSGLQEPPVLCHWAKTAIRTTTNPHNSLYVLHMCMVLNASVTHLAAMHSVCAIRTLDLTFTILALKVG